MRILNWPLLAVAFALAPLAHAQVSLPPKQPVVVAQTVDYRTEIIAYVVDPCFLDSVKRNRVEGVSDQDMLALLKVMQAGAVDDMVGSLLPVVQKMETLEQRAIIYATGAQVCINAARKGQ